MGIDGLDVEWGCRGGWVRDSRGKGGGTGDFIR